MLIVAIWAIGWWLLQLIGLFTPGTPQGQQALWLARALVVILALVLTILVVSGHAAFIGGSRWD